MATEGEIEVEAGTEVETKGEDKTPEMLVILPSSLKTSSSVTSISSTTAASTGNSRTWRIMKACSTRWESKSRCSQDCWNSRLACIVRNRNSSRPRPIRSLPSLWRSWPTCLPRHRRILEASTVTAEYQLGSRIGRYLKIWREFYSKRNITPMMKKMNIKLRISLHNMKMKIPRLNLKKLSSIRLRQQK